MIRSGRGDSPGVPPSIQLVNLFNTPNRSATVPAQLWPGTQYLRGYHFKPNTLVRPWLDRVGGQTFQQLDADFAGTHAHPRATTDARGGFFTNFEWPRATEGAHTLFAVEDGIEGKNLTLLVVGTG